MGEWQRKRSGASFCFSAEVSEGEEKASRGGAITAAASGRHLRRRLLAKVFRWLAISPCLAPNRSEGKESRRLMAAPPKELDLGGEKYHRKAASIFYSSTSSAVSPSRFPPAFVAALQEAEEPNNHRPKRSTPKIVTEVELRADPPGSWADPIGMLLFVVSLSVVVFCGRVCSIAWTSSLLFLVACLCCILEDPEQKEEESAPDDGAPVRLSKRVAEEKKWVVYFEGPSQRKTNLFVD